MRVDRSVLIGRPVAVFRTPKPRAYGALPGRHTPTMTPGISAFRISARIARVSFALWIGGAFLAPAASGGLAADAMLGPPDAASDTSVIAAIVATIGRRSVPCVPVPC